MLDTLPGTLLFIQVLLKKSVIAIVAVLAVVCLLDWLVRTRRIGPFSALARFMRNTVDPLIVPMERQVVRAGGMPSSAPLWALVAAVIGGILLISLFNFISGALINTLVLATSGSRGLFVLLVQWTFGIMQLALLVRVIVSWLPISPYSPWVRWAFALSEPILAPLRNFIPRLGMLDITPLVAYFALQILERAFLSLMM